MLSFLNVTTSIPVVIQSLKNDQAVSTVVRLSVCALWWINYMPLKKACLGPVQSKKLILSKLPIISRKLAIQADYYLRTRGDKAQAALKQ